MKKNLTARSSFMLLTAMILGISLLLPACIHNARKVSEDTAKAIFPARDEVLIFNRAVDYTYLRVLDAIQLTPYWDIYTTEKREGVIMAYNQKYADPFAPMEQRIATIYIKRISRDRTAVELAPASQTLIGIDDVMKSIKTEMNR